MTAPKMSPLDHCPLSRRQSSAHQVEYLPNGVLHGLLRVRDPLQPLPAVPSCIMYKIGLRSGLVLYIPLKGYHRLEPICGVFPSGGER